MLRAFFAKTIKSQGRAAKSITLDGYAASHRAVREMKTDGLLPEDMTLRSSKYLNNLIEQDHRNIKSRINAMLGFKLNLTKLRLKDTAAPAAWTTVLSAR